MKPLFRRAGGKGRMLKHLKPLVPEFTHYIEPFVGGGAMFFDLLPESATLNDKDPYVYHFLRMVVEKDEKLLQQIEGNIYQWEMSIDWETQDKFYYAQRTIFNSYITDFPDKYDHIRIASWWLMNQLSFGGMTRYNKSGQFNVPYGHYNKKNLRKQYEAILEFSQSKIKPVTFNFDAWDIIETVHIFALDPKEEVFIFLDPPYLTPFNDYGNGGFLLHDYVKLRNFIEEATHYPNVKFLLIVSYHPDLDPVIDQMIANDHRVRVESLDGKYMFNIKNRFSTKTKYITVRNY